MIKFHNSEGKSKTKDFKIIHLVRVLFYSLDFSPSGSPGREGRRGSEGGQAEAAGKQSSLLNKEQNQLYCTVVHIQGNCDDIPYGEVPFSMKFEEL